MAIVTELELPEFDYLADDLTGEVYHQRLAEVRSRGWLASSPLSYVVLDREAGEFFLRSKGTAFPGREIADLFGVTGGRLREQIDANILNLTGARHRRLRALVGQAFSPRAADAWRPVMRGYLERLWAGIEPATSAEFVARPGQAVPLADHHGGARSAGGGCAAAARVVALGAAPVRRPRAGQRAAADRAGDRRALRLRRGAAGAAPGRARRRLAVDAAGRARGTGPAVPPRMRQPGAERAGRRHRHHPEPAGARHAAVRRAPGPVGAAGHAPGTDPPGRDRGAAVRADHAVHRPHLRGPARAPGGGVPARDDRGGLRGAGQPRAGRR